MVVSCCATGVKLRSILTCCNFFSNVGSSVVRINLQFVSEALLWYHRQPPPNIRPIVWLFVQQGKSRPWLYVNGMSGLSPCALPSTQNSQPSHGKHHPSDIVNWPWMNPEADRPLGALARPRSCSGRDPSFAHRIVGGMSVPLPFEIFQAGAREPQAERHVQSKTLLPPPPLHAVCTSAICMHITDYGRALAPSPKGLRQAPLQGAVVQ